MTSAILFFSTVLLLAAMLCWTTISVTKKVIAYKTLRLEVSSANARILDGASDGEVSTVNRVTETNQSAEGKETA